MEGLVGMLHVRLPKLGDLEFRGGRASTRVFRNISP